MPKITLAFDIYGTLIDTNGITAALRAHTENALAASQLLRDKQLEYSFRRALMRRYEDFSVCTQQALDYVDAAHDLKLRAAEKKEIMQAYSRLPPYPDTEETLRTLSSQGYRIFAFSNGSHAAVEKLLRHAAVDAQFREIVSVEAVRSFKPDPAVYEYFLTVAEAQARNTWLISGNSFDLLGAAAVGFHTARIRRTGAQVFNEWEFSPRLSVERLSDLPAALSKLYSESS